MPLWLFHMLVLVSGLVVLGLGGEMLVRGAARLARTLGVSPLVIGLTVVAFGTSAPEAAVTVFAAATGTPEAASLAVGNVVGSNIANLLLILGLAAVVHPLTVSRGLLRMDGPVMVVTSALLLGLAAWNQILGRLEGALFVVGIVVYTAVTYRLGRQVPAPEAADVAPLKGWGRYRWFNTLLVALGVGGLVGGARLIVAGATGLATLLGISEHVIGLTVVALGTSLPELATVVVAARHREPDIAIGNVVGSNIFNVLFVTGAASLTRPLPVPAAIIHFDGPLMLGVTLVTFALMWTGRRINRLEGILLLAGYVAYITWTGWQAA